MFNFTTLSSYENKIIVKDSLISEKENLNYYEIDYLESKNVIVNIRRSRGKDIDAACGQLANKNELAN